jgi:hypothetical protein
MTLLSLLNAERTRRKAKDFDRSMQSAINYERTTPDTRDGMDVQLSKRSPCLTTCSYWAFFLSLLFVSTTPLTLSIVQFSRPAEIRRDRSLQQ